MKKFVKPFGRISKNDVSVAGGKGAQLGEMTKAGFPVPAGFVVLTSAFDLFVKENNLRQVIKYELKKVDPKNTITIRAASKKIKESIMKGKISKKIEDAILKEFDLLKLKLVAARSSATAEDSSKASWAGELETYVNVEKSGLLSAVKKCWASLFTERAISYAKQKKIPEANISVAVVVQKMLQSEVSGVAFTVNPVSKNKNQLMIEAGFGLGESIVAGLITPDKYLVNKDELFIEEITVNKQERMIAKKGKKTLKLKISKEKQEIQKLEGKKIIELAKLCKQIEGYYSSPQDIEWALEKGKFYILQVRPITTL